ncbi:MAG: hypothetical protein Cons2KO_15690 [Congregibacter sp.]
MRRVCAFCVLALLLSVGIQAQEKIERERKIRASAVPEPARGWLKDVFESSRRLRWYEETHESGRSYEAKFKWRGQRYSVEFGLEGSIQDVEIEIAVEDIPSPALAGMQTYLASTYRTYSIERVQIQYSGASDDLEDFFDDYDEDDLYDEEDEGENEACSGDDDSDGLITRFEVEYTAAVGSAPSVYWEGLFDDCGRLLQRRRVIVPSIDNLLF